MKILNGIFLLGTNVAATHIKNNCSPVCKNCIHYVPHSLEQYSTCKLFGTKEIVTGEIRLEDCRNCRNDETKCGLEGKYFYKEPHPRLKRLFYNISLVANSLFVRTFLVSFTIFFGILLLSSIAIQQ